ncbi:MAG: PD-(D/E)XK nuclease family protein, partial [Akkermansia sp.]|nr:PD-(D/E)XK nuclease family protein [Akkermansia sp.]
TPGVEVYCEQSIEAITKADEWVSGTIDRWVLTTDAAGRTIGAHIIDFKTNKLRQNEPYQELKKEYTGQMTAYKRLISQAFDLPATAVKVSLLSCPKGHMPARVLTYTDDELPI